MTKKELLKNLKEGQKNYSILELLWDNKKAVVPYKVVIASCLKNPIKRGLLNNPDIFEDERRKVEHIINRLNMDLKKRGFRIRNNRRLRGFVLRDFAN